MEGFWCVMAMMVVPNGGGGIFDARTHFVDGVRRETSDLRSVSSGQKDTCLHNICGHG